MGIDFKRPRHIRGFRLGEVMIFGPGIGKVLVEKTVSGAIASFSDGADDVPIKSANFGIVASGGGGTPSSPVPIVGVSSVKVFQTGKNLIDTDASAWENNGIDYQSGQNATSATKKRTIGYYPIKGYQNIVVSGVTVEVGSSSFRFYWYDKDYNFLGYKSFPAVPYSVGYKKACYFRLAVDRTIDVSALQIEYAETTASTYEAYKAKTPITIQLGQTVYGGTLAEDGTLTVTHGIMTLPATGWTYYAVSGHNTFNCIITGCKTGIWGKCEAYNFEQVSYISQQSDKCFYFYSSASGVRISIRDDDYTDATTFGQAVEGLKLVYPLATPIVITGLDEISLSTYLGDNNIWCDSGDSEVTYYADESLIPDSSTRSLQLSPSPEVDEEVVDEEVEEGVDDMR